MKQIVNLQNFYPYQKQLKLIPWLKFGISVLAIVSLGLFLGINLILLFLVTNPELKRDFSGFMGKMLAFLHPLVFLVFAIQGFKKGQTNRKKYGFSKLYAAVFILYNLYICVRMIIILESNVVRKNPASAVLIAIQVMNYLNFAVMLIMVILEITIIVIMPKISKIKVHNFRKKILSATANKQYASKKIRYHRRVEF